MSGNVRRDWQSVAAWVGVVVVALVFAGCSRQAPKKQQSRPRSGGTPKAASSKSTPAKAPQDEKAEPVALEPPLREKEFRVELAPGVVMEFVAIRPGTFMMGEDRGDIPRHREVIARPFYLGKHEVTQQQWQAVMGNNPSLHKDPKRPVERVNWDDCLAFLNKMNENFGHTGMTFALPTEAQWEYACRAGDTTKFGTADDPEKIGQYAWLGANSGVETHPVGQKKPNDWGLYDMHGNVAEWCADVNTAGGKASTANPGGASGEDEFHVVRGGCWRDGEKSCTSTSRVLRRGFVPLRFDGLRLVCMPKRASDR